MARLTFLLLLLWVGVTVSTVVDLQKRIYGGKDCKDKERLYHVGLTNNATGDNIHCGGSLIYEQWVLTAAHCCDSMYAVVGVHPGPGNPVIIQEKHIYQNHDIMLMKLQNPVTNINPIPLPDDGECKSPLKIGEVVGVAGHGRYRIDKKTGEAKPGQPTHLQCATMKVSKCDTKTIKISKPNEPSGNWICYEERYVDTCPGDSGGGVEYQGKLRAVHVSGGRYVCTMPAVSLDVCKYKQWIEEKTT